MKLRYDANAHGDVLTRAYSRKHSCAEQEHHGEIASKWAPHD